MELSMPTLGKSKQGSGAFEDPPLVSPKEAKAGKEEKPGKPGYILKITSGASLKTKAGAVENGGAAPVLHMSQSEEELRTVFKYFDRDGDGRISIAELSLTLRSFGEEISDGELQELMKQIDKDNDGLISVEELIAFNQTASGGGALSPVHDPVISAFQMFDVVGDGYMSASELRSILNCLGETVHSLDECTRIMAAAQVAMDEKLNVFHAQVEGLNSYLRLDRRGSKSELLMIIMLLLQAAILVHAVVRAA